MLKVSLRANNKYYSRALHAIRSTCLMLAGAILAVPFIAASQAAAASAPYINEYPIPQFSSEPVSIAKGSDGKLWFSENGLYNTVASMDTSGNVTQHPYSDSYYYNNPRHITAGPDGAIWFTDVLNEIGRIDTNGIATEYPVPKVANNDGTVFIAPGPDGALWFTDTGSYIGRIDTTGNVTEFPLPSADTDGQSIAVGSDGNLWITEPFTNTIVRMDTSGSYVEFTLPQLPGGAQPNSITNGPDGALWFSELSSGGNSTSAIGRITTAGSVTEFPLANAHDFPDELVTGPDGNMWFTDPGSNQIGQVTPVGIITEYPTPTPGSSPVGITVGPDNNIWFPELATRGDETTGNIGQLIINPDLTATTPTDVPALSWTAVSGADSYNIYRDGTLLDSSTTNSYTDTTASVGIHTYYITSVTGGVESSPSNSIRVNVVTFSTPSFTSTDNASSGMRRSNQDQFRFTVSAPGTPDPAITESGALPSGINFWDNRDGTATMYGSPNAGTQGTYPITFTASNGAGTATQNFTLTVTTTPTQPTFQYVPPQTAQFGMPFSVTITSSGYPFPKITKNGTLPQGLKFKDNGDGTATISGTPTGTALGNSSINITAQNSLSSSSTNIYFTITKVPVFKSLGGQSLTANVGTPYSLTFISSAYYTAAMTESGALPDGLSFTDNGDGTATIAGTPNPGSGAAYPITITATNQYGSASKSISLKIDELPAINSANNYTASVGTTFSFQMQIIGFPVPKVTYTGTLPKGVTLSAKGLLKGKPAANTAGSYPIAVTATSTLGVATQNFTLIVQ